jgi:hypothetical protein
VIINKNVKIVCLILPSSFRGQTLCMPTQSRNNGWKPEPSTMLNSAMAMTTYANMMMIQDDMISAPFRP